LLTERDDPKWHAHVDNVADTAEVVVFRDFANPS